MSEQNFMEAMERMMKELQELKGQMQQVRAAQVLPAVAQSSGAAGPMSEDEDLEEETGPSWSDILRQRRRQATGDEAVKFLKLLETAPDLQALRDSKSDVALYSGVPEAPGPRRNRIDSQLYQPQAKMELGLHLMAHFFECGNKSALAASAAWQRSAWQDLQEQRRQFMAGREAWKLQRRQDDKSLKLLSEEEEKKIGKQWKDKEKPRDGAGKGDKGRFRDSRPTWRRDWTQDQGSWRDRSRVRSSSYGKGKGKGKGGRGREQK